MKVQLTSFSYKTGLPKEFKVWSEETHGGGFVFDCRAIPNPGREERFKKLSGLDPSVKDFIATHAEADNFLRNSFELVKGSIQTYLARGFSFLTVAYGCTGGQHRSVYFVENLAALLKKEFGSKIEIHITHSEEKSWKK